MRNNIPNILIKMVNSLKENSKLVGSDLIFVKREPERIITQEEGSDWISIRHNYKKEFILKIFVFRDFEPIFSINSQNDIRKFLPLLYTNNVGSIINSKRYIFEFFGNAGFFSENQQLPADLPGFCSGNDIWEWSPFPHNGWNFMIRYRRCPNCNSYFAPDHELQKYCDGSCRSKMYVKHRRRKLLKEKNQKKVLEVNCRYCDGIFETSKKNAKYCGIMCRMAAYRKRKEKGIGISRLCSGR